MYFTGELKKDGKFWMIEVPMLEVATQGKTRKEALEMIADAIELLVDKKGFKIQVRPIGPYQFLITAKDLAQLLALFVKRRREAEKLTIRAFAKKLGYKSHTSYAQYETGKHMPGIDFVDRVIKVTNPDTGLCLTTVKG